MPSGCANWRAPCDRVLRHRLPFEPVGSELTFDDGSTVFAQEQSLMVAYSDGSHARSAAGTRHSKTPKHF